MIPVRLLRRECLDSQGVSRYRVGREIASQGHTEGRFRPDPIKILQSRGRGAPDRSYGAMVLTAERPLFRRLPVRSLFNGHRIYNDRSRGLVTFWVEATRPKVLIVADQPVRVPQPSNAQPGDASWRNDFASRPVTHGHRHPVNVQQVTAVSALIRSSQRMDIRM
jgi:hypothetical protein